MNNIIGLRQMNVNQSGYIHHLSSHGELGRRLRDMGLTPGTEITIKGRAPLKDPVALRVRDCILTLRNNEADYILVNIGERDV
ncbi:MAG TPA: FeoA family protein [Desulfohalobiaceae bacterium]|nr:FeoA family protein [Desulfohalobiaceae bacterium]